MMVKVKYINPIWERRDRYGFCVRQYQYYTGSIQSETPGELYLKSDKFLHCLSKASIVEIDDSPVSYDIAEDKKITVDGSKGNKYLVERVMGIDSCSCPAFKFRKRCKHLLHLDAA